MHILFIHTLSFYVFAVEDLTKLSSQERFNAFPELSRDQIDTLLKVYHISLLVKSISIPIWSLQIHMRTIIYVVIFLLRL